MARCHHDNLELDSNVTIEVAREGDILEAGEELKDRKCEKNPGHIGFIPFKDLTLGDIPDRNVDMFNEIKSMGSRVVRLVVDKIKKGKKVRECGTGYVVKFNNVYYILTNNHVVKNNEDVRNCTIEFNYDSYDGSNIITSRGVELLQTDFYRDISWFTFDPVPDYIKQLDFLDLKLFYPTIVIMYKNGKVVRKEPFMKYKQHVIHYTGIDLNNPKIDTMFLELIGDSINYLTSSYFKFQPIPSNIQDITNIKIHVDEDDGNSRVISGDVVKFEDEYVVKISESILQDKVKKCRLVWNGKVISRGTRLYVQPIPSREFFSDEFGVDLEKSIKECPTNVWVFDFQPKPSEAERQLETLHDFPTGKNMCCIGHPHTGIKMVTFGTLLDFSVERFNNNGDHIKEPGKDCQCKEVSCTLYSCKTCPGSSGSPVYQLDDLLFHQIHFMGYKTKPYDLNGTLVENVNIAYG